MKKNYLILILAMLFFLGLQFNSTLAQDQTIRISLTRPPVNKLNVSDLWKLDLENITNENLTIYLEGTVTEDKAGIIVEGQSKVFVVKPGKTSYGYNDFKNGSVNWKNKKYQEAIVRTGNAPTGIYTICVTAKLESGEIAGQENCIEQNIEISSEQQVMLISPNDGEELDPDTSPAFMWNSGGSGPFDIRIIEIKGSESRDEAMKINRPFFEQKGIKGNSFQYPVTAPKFVEGKKYAWMVSSGTGISEVWAFNISHIILLTTISGNCCAKFVKEITQTYLDGGGLNVSLKAGSNTMPIRKVTMCLVYLKSVTDPNCPECKAAHTLWGSFICMDIFGTACQLGGFGGPVHTDGHSRELTWSNNTGVDMYNTPRSGSFGILLDPVVSGAVSNVLMKCCKTDVEFCIRYSFTDISCVTCDTVICSKTSIGGVQPKTLDDSVFQNYRKIDEQIKKQNEEPNIKEQEKEKKDGEGQGSSSLIKHIFIKGIDNNLFKYSDFASYYNRHQYFIKTN
ncbi:MAG: hypothetical protein EHM58_08255 [Ignavibacteriae bacterium]|nr:MAG: hypothetical protein EHM58_08255 [Ignavibacteriota bacterium]